MNPPAPSESIPTPSNKQQSDDNVNIILNFGSLKDLMMSMTCKICEEKKANERLEAFADYVMKNKNHSANVLTKQFIAYETKQFNKTYKEYCWYFNRTYL